MPEGDTVWRTAQRLHQALSGQPLTGCDIRVPRFAEVDLAGQVVLETTSRGKHILTRFEQVTLHTHLRMDGAWHIYRAGSPWRSPAFEARVVLATSSWQAVGFRLGNVDVVARADEHTLVGHLGPDLLGPDWSSEEAVRRIRSQPDRPIGEALLDQRNLAGIGNLYKAELCFLLGVHLDTPVREVGVLVQLVHKAHRLLSANKQRAEQTTTGDTRRDQRLWVYRRAGQPCRRCRTPIASATLPTASDRARDSSQQSAVGSPSQARVSYWCPTCQPPVD